MSYFDHYAVTPSSIGDWDGQEELAAAQVNRIYRLLDASLSPSVPPQLAHNIFSRVWDDWGYDMRLLDATDEDFRRYALALLRTAA